MSMWRAIVCDTFEWKGRVRREREVIEPLTDGEMHLLLAAGVIGAPQRIPEPRAPEIETATASAPETTARNYRRSR